MKNKSIKEELSALVMIIFGVSCLILAAICVSSSSASLIKRENANCSY